MSVRVERPVPAGARQGAASPRETLDSRGAWALVGVLFGLVAIALPELGSDPWRFLPPSVDPQGLLGPLVRAAGEEWDVGIARAAAFAAALACGAFALFLLARRRPAALPRWSGVALVLCVALLLSAPSTLLQLGLRDATAPWFFTNDSTYQIELGGDLLLDLDNPYGHDYRRVRAGALLHPRRQRVGAGARARGGPGALRLLPGQRAGRRPRGDCCPTT